MRVLLICVVIGTSIAMVQTQPDEIMLVSQNTNENPIKNVAQCHPSPKNGRDIWNVHVLSANCRRNDECVIANSPAQKKKFIEEAYSNLFTYDNNHTSEIGERNRNKSRRVKRSNGCCATYIETMDGGYIHDTNHQYYEIVQFGSACGYQFYKKGSCVDKNSACGDSGRCTEVAEDLKLLVFDDSVDGGMTWKWFYVDHRCECVVYN